MLVSLNKNVSKSHLRWGGLLLGLFLALIGLVLWWRFDTEQAHTYLWYASVIVPVIYYAIPPLQKPIYLGWLIAVFPIGMVVSEVVLMVTYYLAVFPIGFIRRLGGWDPLDRTLLPDADSYYIERKQETDKERYFSQF